MKSKELADWISSLGPEEEVLVLDTSGTLYDIYDVGFNGVAECHVIHINNDVED